MWCIGAREQLSGHVQCTDMDVDGFRPVGKFDEKLMAGWGNVSVLAISRALLVSQSD